MTTRPYPDCDDRDCDVCQARSGCPAYEREEPLTMYVYVAGPLSAPPSEYLAYVHRMSIACRQLVERRCCPLNPGADLVEGLTHPDVLPVEAYKRRGLETLTLLAYAKAAGHPVCVWVLAVTKDGGQSSSGVLAELALAQELGIPIVESIEEVCALRGTE